MLGYKNAAEVRRSGRLFTKGHSAGPAPWVSDGKWQDADFLLKKFKSVESKNELNGWYDIHAAKNKMAIVLIELTQKRATY